MYPNKGYPRAIGSFNYPIPIIDVEPGATPLTVICINPAWIPVIVGCLSQLLLQSSWDTEDIETLSNQIGRVMDLRELIGMSNPCCQLRIVDGVPEVSSDGGVTWTPVPQTSPGESGHAPQEIEPIKPPRTGTNIPCLAAANATACLVALHAEICSWWDAGAIVLVFCGAIAAILGLFFPVFWTAFSLTVNWLTIVNDILNHTDALTPASFTTEIQDALTCILYRQADSNGQWSEAVFTDILAEVAGHTGSMWALIHIYLEQIGGYRALNNAGTTNSVATHDCDACTGWCRFWDFELSQNGFRPSAADGTGWGAAYSGGLFTETGGLAFAIAYDWPAAAHITRIKVFTDSGGGGGGNIEFRASESGGTSYGLVSVSAYPIDVYVDLTIPVACKLMIQDSYTCHISGVQVWGDGDEPSFIDGAACP